MTQKRTERVFVVGVSGPNQTPKQMRSSLEEMSRLINTAGGVVVGQATQAMRRFDPATLVGVGKLEEIVDQLKAIDVDLVAVDCPLTPVQFRNLEKECGVRVVDRTGVILDIFALHARSRAGKLQVEAAQLAWQLPRLTGQGKELSQQVGGYIGMRGPGETKLEVDRRRIRERMTRLRQELAELETERNAIRAKRDAKQIPVIALVGYTNAGKSTLLNRLTKSKALVADQLFATLDPLMRRLKLPSGRHVLITDTVGFIRNLPHELIEAFHSTFEEVARADLLLHVVDASSADAGQQFVTVKEVLWQLKFDHIPQVIAVNKIDLVKKRLKLWGEKAISVSAVSGTGIKSLLRAIDDALVVESTFMKLRIPYVASKSIPALYEHARVRKIAYRQKWVAVEVDIPNFLVTQFKPFSISD